MDATIAFRLACVRAAGKVSEEKPPIMLRVSLVAPVLAALAACASAQLSNANDDPSLSVRDNYGIGFGVGGPLLALLIAYVFLRNSQKPHDLSSAFPSILQSRFAYLLLFCER